MFLPCERRSLVNNGARMIGMKVYAWTTDGHIYTYGGVGVLGRVFSGPGSTGSHDHQEIASCAGVVASRW